MELSSEAQKYLEDYGASLSPASPDQITQLREKNADGDTVDYFESLNLAVELPIRNLITFDSAEDIIDQMGWNCPDCEVWQHGFIAFARDMEGRVYCFDQNHRDEAGRSKIVRHPYPVGDDCTLEGAIKASEPIAENFLEFISLLMADPNIELD